MNESFAFKVVNRFNQISKCLKAYISTPNEAGIKLLWICFTPPIEVQRGVECYPIRMDMDETDFEKLCIECCKQFIAKAKAVDGNTNIVLM